MYFSGKNFTKFNEEDEVLVLNYKNNKRYWIEGIVKDKIGKNMYIVFIPKLNLYWRRHVNQIKHFNWKKSMPENLGNIVNSKNLVLNGNVNIENSEVERNVNRNWLGQTENLELSEHVNNYSENCVDLDLRSNNVNSNSGNSSASVNKTPEQRPKRNVKPIERFGY